MLTLPRVLITYITSFLNASNTLALRSVCKKLHSFIFIGRFRLRLNGPLSSSLFALHAKRETDSLSSSLFASHAKRETRKRYEYVCYTGTDYVNDLRGCEIRKLWLLHSKFKHFHYTTKIHTLVVNNSFCSFFDIKRRSAKYYKNCILSQNFTDSSSNFDDSGMLGYYNKKNLHIYSFETKPLYSTPSQKQMFEKKDITDFKKIIVQKKCENFNPLIKKLKIINHFHVNLSSMLNLTHLYLHFINFSSRERVICFPPNLKVLKLYYITNNCIPTLPDRLKKLKLRFCDINLINSIILPKSVRWYKVIVSDENKGKINEPRFAHTDLKKNNTTYILKYV